MSNGRGAPTIGRSSRDAERHPRGGRRSLTPAGYWSCIRCQNLVLRGTRSCACGNVPPSRVSAVPEPSRRTATGNAALLQQILENFFNPDHDGRGRRQPAMQPHS